MPRSLDDLEARVRELDARIRPVAEAPIDVSRPGWRAALEAAPHPLDRTGTRAEAERVIGELLEGYAAADAAWRAEARALLRRHPAFAWAAAPPPEPDARRRLRSHLLLFSLHDQGADPRDARLWLAGLCTRARADGLDPAPLLREAAALSADEDRHGQGSTRRWLEEASRGGRAGGDGRGGR